MSVLKKLIRRRFNLLGLQIINLNGYNMHQNKIIEIINKANSFYSEALQNRSDTLTDPELLQLL